MGKKRKRKGKRERGKGDRSGRGKEDIPPPLS